MRKPVNITLPFTAAVGTSGSIQLLHDGQSGDMPHLSIDVGHPISGSRAGASLTVEHMRQLVDGLMDCIYAVERKGRINNEACHD